MGLSHTHTPFPSHSLCGLTQVGAGVMSTLANQHRKEAISIYHRFYRSYIRAFTDAKDAAPSRPEHGPLDDDDFVTRSEFRLLLRYLGIYATWCGLAPTSPPHTHNTTSPPHTHNPTSPPHAHNPTSRTPGTPITRVTPGLRPLTVARHPGFSQLIQDAHLIC